MDKGSQGSKEDETVVSGLGVRASHDLTLSYSRSDLGFKNWRNF